MENNPILFRCSQIGKIMTEPRSKSELLSETAKSACIERWIQQKYGREKDYTTDAIQKGLQVEEDAITLYSCVKKRFFKKNEKRLHNAFITGIPDLFTGNEIMQAESVIDIKSSWDIFTFYESKLKAFSKDYFWQLQGYMALTGADMAILVFCLVDTPEFLINKAKQRFLWDSSLAEDDKMVPEMFETIEKNMKFQDVPQSERCHEIEIQRDDYAILRIYDRVDICRQFLNTLNQ